MVVSVVWFGLYLFWWFCRVVWVYVWWFGNGSWWIWVCFGVWIMWRNNLGDDIMFVEVVLFGRFSYRVFLWWGVNDSVVSNNCMVCWENCVYLERDNYGWEEFVEISFFDWNVVCGWYDEDR